MKDELLNEAELLKIIHEVIWLEVYTPFFGAMMLICVFFWNIRKSDKKEMTDFIRREYEDLKKGQEAQTEMLNEISKCVIDIRITNGRIDERVGIVENSIERRKENRSLNSVN